MSDKYRDPIHGFIEVSDLENKIINSAPFQRLRNIKQLAMTYMVFHGVEHTRTPCTEVTCAIFTRLM